MPSVKFSLISIPFYSSLCDRLPGRLFPPSPFHVDTDASTMEYGNKDKDQIIQDFLAQKEKDKEALYQSRLKEVTDSKVLVSLS